MTSSQSRGFDNQYDVNAAMGLNAACMSCSRGGPCLLGGACGTRDTRNNFPYVEGTTNPCGLANCGIPEQPYLDQLMFVTPASMDGSVEREQEAAFPTRYFYETPAYAPMRQATPAPGQAAPYWKDPYYMAPYASGKETMGVYAPEFNVLTNDFDNNSIVAGNKTDKMVTDTAAWEKQQLSESSRRPLIEAPIVDPLYVGLGQQGSQGGHSSMPGALGMIVGGAALAGIAYLGYQALH